MSPLTHVGRYIIVSVLVFSAVPKSFGNQLPNVLLITVDTLRADRLGCYGYTKQTSPFIDQLASQGVLFENAMAPTGFTYPSLTSLHSSLYPVTHTIRGNSSGPIPDEIILMAEVFASSGYATAAFIANAQWGNWQGFEVVEFIRDEEIGARALRFMGNVEKQPVFLWLHYYRPHQPYWYINGITQDFIDEDYETDANGSNAYLESVQGLRIELSPRDLARIDSLYDAEIRFVNDEIRKLWIKMKSRGYLDDAVVVFTADHGETLFDRNRYFFHGELVHECVIRVPLFIRAPERVSTGRRIDDVVELIDIAPTIFEMVGLSIPQQFQGRSLVPLTEGKSLPSKPAVSEIGGKVLALRTEAFRYVYNPTHYHPPMRWKAMRDVGRPENEARYFIDKVELFRSWADPGELNNLAEELPGMVRQMERLRLEWAERYSWKLDDTSKSEDPVDLERREQLEALGYID